MVGKVSQRLISVLDAIKDGIYIIDSDYTLEFMNKAMIRDFGEGIGKKCYRVINNLDDICPWCRAKEVFKGETLRWEHHVPNIHKTYDLLEHPLENTDGTISKLSICRDITQRKKREEKIKASEEDYRRLFEHVGCGVYISSKKGKFLNANQAALDMLNYGSKEEFLKIDITKDLYLRPKDRRKFQDMIERDGNVIDYEVGFKRKDGSPIPVLLTSHVRYDQQGNVLGYEGLIVDESHRKQMEKKLREAHDFFNMIIQSSPNAIMAADMKGNISIWNRASEETLGYKSEETIGRMNITNIYPEGVAKEIMEMMRSPEYGGVGKLRSYPMVYVRRDGKIVEGNLSAAIIYDAKGKEVASVGIFVDLEERLEMERKLRQTQEQLLQSEKLAAMGRLTSQIAHELNNPLSVISGQSQLLAETEADPEKKQILKQIQQNTSEISAIIDELMGFAEPQQPRPTQTNIRQMLDEAIQLTSAKINVKNINVQIEVADGVENVFVDSAQIVSAIANVISNSLESYIDELGPVKITADADKSNDLVKLAISDLGCGMDAETLQKATHPLFSAKPAGRKRGMGLAHAARLIQLNKGTLEIASEPGRETTVTIYLPTG
ncbi:MAG: PAS domain S-box protein [Desulfobacteraceae bacterium]|nr:PAS domain S-box protein [Desulfobacteraceae bacterium]